MFHKACECIQQCIIYYHVVHVLSQTGDQKKLNSTSAELIHYFGYDQIKIKANTGPASD